MKLLGVDYPKCTSIHPAGHRCAAEILKARGNFLINWQTNASWGHWIWPGLSTVPGGGLIITGSLN